MAEYIERIDAIKAVNKQNAFTMTRVALIDSLNSIPAADVVPVVRCKDCKHSTLPSELTQRYGVPGTLTCHNRYAPCNRRNVGGNDFCSYGERKEEI